jgi:hypothetical protein
VLRPVGDSTSSRSSISGLSTKRLTSTLYDIIYNFLNARLRQHFYYLFITYIAIMQLYASFKVGRKHLRIVVVFEHCEQARAKKIPNEVIPKINKRVDHVPREIQLFS